MNNRLWAIGALVLTPAIFATTWFIGISPILIQTGVAETELAATQSTNAAHSAKLASLRERFDSLPALESELDATRASLPSDASMAGFLGDLDELQVAHGVTLTSFLVSDGIPFVPAVDAAVDVGTETDDTPDTEVTQETVSVVNAIPNAELVTGENFIAIPITLSATGGYGEVMNFVAGLQSGGRLFLVTKLSVAEDSNAERNGYSATVDGFAYTLLDPTLQIVDGPDSSDSAAVATVG
jgi:Tfp pilus assembly protein PilO